MFFDSKQKVNMNSQKKRADISIDSFFYLVKHYYLPFT
ncbi:MAG: hypothetical protein ACJA1H_002401 [Glaciecola sp.]|jgi:hypothetical protein